MPMTPMRRPRRRSPSPPARVLLALAVLGAGVAACSSGGATTTQVAATCQRVGAVLSDGPDPTADPVGYAEAQVRPLAAVHTSDTSLARTIDRLDRAFRAFTDDDGSAAAGRTLAAAEKQMNARCPGVAP